MKCPNCEYNFLAGNVCPDCGIDVIIYEKTIRISDVLYNKGLSLARVRDMSGALDSLTKSIQFNKNNYYARNLLGLVYFETGKIGDALKQWVISASLMKRDNPAVIYIDAVQNAPNLLDDYNDAVGMYNSALLHIQQKSDDLAIIQLKKALEKSPGFLDAMNLLTFCYLIKGDRDLAGILSEKTLSMDINNPKALNYFKVLYPDKKRINMKEAAEATKLAAPQSLSPGKLSMDEVTRKKLFGTNFFFAEILCFVVGGLCTLALIYFAYIPGQLNDKDKEISSLKTQLNTAEASVSTELAEALEKSERLEKDKNELISEIDRLTNLMSAEDNSQRIAMAQTYFNNGNFVEAAKTIFAIDPSGLDDSSLNQYKELKTNAYGSAAIDLYNAGLTHFNVDNNEDAARAFENCLLYADPDAEYVDSATYYLGQLAERKGDKTAAIAYYETVVDNYPQSNKINSAKARLTDLKDD